MPSKHGKSSGEPPEILQHLGRAALAYGISRLTRQESSKSSDKSSAGPKKRKHDSSPPSSSKSKSHHTSSRSKDKSDDTSTASSHRSSRSHSRKRSSKSRSRASPGPTADRADNSELHHHISQLAAGALAFGVQQFMHHRHERKRQKAAAPPSGAKDPRGSRDPHQQREQARGIFTTGKPRADPELSAALASLDGELQGTAQEIGRLARKKPDHRDCEVHRGLVDSEQRIQRGLDGLRSSVNNVRNLHPGVGGPERMVPVAAAAAAATGRKREERARKREAEARIREAEERAREGRGRRERMPVPQPPPQERDGARRERRERPSWDARERRDAYERPSRVRDDWGGLGGGRDERRWMRW